MTEIKDLVEATIAACQNVVNVLNDVDFFSSGNLTMTLLHENKEWKRKKKFKEKEHECNSQVKGFLFSSGKKSHPKQLLVIAAAAIKIDPCRALCGYFQVNNCRVQCIEQHPKQNTNTSYFKFLLLLSVCFKYLKIDILPHTKVEIAV